jgi:hypothetical protein
LKGPGIPELAIHLQLDLRVLNPATYNTFQRAENSRERTITPPPPGNSHKTTAEEVRPLPPHARNFFAVASSVQLPHLHDARRLGNEPLTATMVERRTRIEGSHSGITIRDQICWGLSGAVGAARIAPRLDPCDATGNISRLLRSTMSNMKSRLKS